MKTTPLLVLACLLSMYLQAQTSEKGCLSKNQFTYFNGFQHTKSDPEKRSLAISHAQNLAKICPGSLQSLFHTYNAQSFSKRIRGARDNKNERILLDMLVQDTSQVIKQTLEPLVLWVKIQESENNTSELIRLTNEFINTQLQKKYWHDDRIARYALLIYQLISPKKECAEIARNLLNKTVIGLKAGLSKYELPGGGIHNNLRAWYRYLYAYSNFLQGEEAKKKRDLINAEKYYRTASDYSPDLLDKNSKTGYFYEMAFLMGIDKSNGFQEDYLAFLEENPNKAQTLKILTSLALSDPTQLEKLQSYYTQHQVGTDPFGTYWNRELQNLPVAPEFNLVQLNNITFTLKVHSGKWILLDFWGTWCELCLKEMPQVQNFYRELKSLYAEKFTLLTIACKDSEAKVKTYLNKNKYNFPVAMSNESIEKQYNIREYPTKILITPEGNMIVLPTGGDWVEKVKLYSQF